MDKIGERIKLLRETKGLSQKQLAGSEMTRAFISQVESGKCKPSLPKLQIIARRLERPLDYFIGNIDYDHTVSILLRECNNLLQKKQVEEAKSIVEQIIKLGPLCKNRELEGDTYFLYGRLYRKDPDIAFDFFLKAEEIFHELNHRTKLLQTLFELANCYYRQEDYRQALRYYKRVTQYASDMKTLQEVLTSSYIYSGSAALRIGDLDLSVRSYESALKSLNGLNLPKKMLDCQLGLGWCFYRLGHLDRAISITQEGIALSKLHSRHLLTQFQQNLAIFYSTEGKPQASYALLNTCLEQYQNSNDTIKQAAILEELAKYWIGMGNAQRAIEMCQKGLDLLKEKTGTLQRGRIYRLLAEIHGKTEENGRALELCRMGIDCFRMVNALDEIKAAEKLLNSFIHKEILASETDLP